MNALTRKLRFIIEDCGMSYQEMQEEEPVESEEENETEFIKKRRELKGALKRAEKMMDERAQMESNSETDKVDVVKISTEIRKQMKEVVSLGDELLQLHEDAKNDKSLRKKMEKGDESVKQRLAVEEESLKVIKQHIERLQKMDRERSGMGDVNTGRPQVNGLEKYKVDELPDIEDDERFLEIRENDKAIDGKLDVLAQGVKDIKQTAKDIGGKIETQKDKLDTLESKVDRNNDRLDGLNEKLRSTLEKVRGPDKMIMTIMCVCLIIGVLSIIAMLFI